MSQALRNDPDFRHTPTANRNRRAKAEAIADFIISTRTTRRPSATERPRIAAAAGCRASSETWLLVFELLDRPLAVIADNREQVLDYALSEGLNWRDLVPVTRFTLTALLGCRIRGVRTIATKPWPAEQQNELDRLLHVARST